MTRRHGRCARGSRSVAIKLHGSLAHADLPVPYAAPDRRVLRHRRPDQRHQLPAYVEQLLVSTFAAGDIVIMDNPRTTKAAVRQLTGPLLPSSCRATTRSQPVERPSKLKTLLRRCPQHRSHMNRRVPTLHCRGMRQLPRHCWLCFRLK
jgi:hypothetical protein